MEYSKYQEDIFEFVKYGYGNAVISAVAGSGKSTTIVKSLDYIKSEKKVLFLAFNSAIVDELRKKINRDNTDIKTLHSLGYSIIRFNYKHKNIIIDENKYQNKLIEYLTDNDIQYSDRKYVTNINKLCNLGRFFLIKNKIDLLKISNKYNIDIINDELDIALYLIRWAKDSLNDDLNVIDYTDMVYLPNVLNVKIFKYDFIIVDEAQDLSISQMSLFMKCFKQGGRFICVGDEKQSINSFAGSDSESFRKLKKQPNTITLPLSISYRCPKNIVRFAQKLVTEIEYSDNAIDGVIDFNSKITDLEDGDMVICRNTSPLLKLYVMLLNDNIKCYIKGVDVGLNLIDLLENINYDDIGELLLNLNELLVRYVNLNKKESNDVDDIYSTQNYNDLVDKIESIKILSIGLKTKDELINKIKNIFSDESTNGICLSTIHKSKGLESDNVYILNKYLTPSKFVKQEWEIEQERNIEYVSYTRAKKKLGFIFNS